MMPCYGVCWKTYNESPGKINPGSHVAHVLEDYHGLSWTTMDYHGLSWTIMDYYWLLQAGPKIGFDIGNGREITGFLSIFNDQDHVEDC